MNQLTEAMSGLGAVLLPVAAGLLFEELTFGGLARLLLASKPGSGKRSSSRDRYLSLGRKRGNHNNHLTQLPQLERQVLYFQCGYIEVFTTCLQIRCGRGFADRGVEAGLLGGRWVG